MHQFCTRIATSYYTEAHNGQHCSSFITPFGKFCSGTVYITTWQCLVYNTTAHSLRSPAIAYNSPSYHSLFDIQGRGRGRGEGGEGRWEGGGGKVKGVITLCLVSWLHHMFGGCCHLHMPTTQMHYFQQPEWEEELGHYTFQCLPRMSSVVRVKLTCGKGEGEGEGGAMGHGVHRLVCEY